MVDMEITFSMVEESAGGMGGILPRLDMQDSYNDTLGDPVINITICQC